GIGLRGPGETQLETDRRLVRARIKMLQKRLEKVRAQREQSRRSRKRNDIPQVALVGYTNAGKSTLFNSLTDAETYAADKLFATLDPTLRRISVPEIGAIVVADTVGFIRHLPHQLVESFRATLEETRDADLLLHVVDCAAEERAEYIEQVNAVLGEIDALKVPTLMIFNKIDLLGEFAPKIDRNENGIPEAVWLSAKANAGIDLLKQAIGERLLGQDWVDQVLQLKPQHGRLRAQLFAAHAVLNEETGEQGETLLRVRLPRRDLLQILKRNELPAAEIGFNDKADASRYNSTSSDLDGENHGVE
ncbi:MAG TPA: GTPase HflX, partial [Pseudomonadales bacterium]|nr:GTPase HflX [Pseudomonadales bacterium]